MKTIPLSVLCTLLFLHQLTAQKKSSEKTYYFPPAGSWAAHTPEQHGINSAALQEAVSFAIASEVKNPRSMEQNHYQTFGKNEPFGDAIGPMKDRGEPTGIIIHKGYVVAQWGEPNRPDMTHSVTKSFLSTVVGLANDKGKISSVYDTVYPYVAPVLVANFAEGGNKADEFMKPKLLDLFSTSHNRTITWDHLLRQTSDWEGTLWGKPDWADRPSDNPAEWLTRKRNLPGTVYEYNDVRVNVLSLAALMVWRNPLPVVLKEFIMDPIGASPTWRWYGYENSWVVLDGQLVQSVSGGGHWGGGMIINAWDMARFGYLFLRNGKWNNQQLISKEWIRLASTPTPAQPGYGFMNWFLNTDKKQFPSAPASVVVHIGNGTNLIYVDQENDLLVVCRWIDGKNTDAFIGKILAAIQH
jgi:CubicO group peptidase (beta-lactamase class C family)